MISTPPAASIFPLFLRGGPALRVAAKGGEAGPLTLALLHLGAEGPPRACAQIAGDAGGGLTLDFDTSSIPGLDPGLPWQLAGATPPQRAGYVGFALLVAQGPVDGRGLGRLAEGEAGWLGADLQEGVAVAVGEGARLTGPRGWPWNAFDHDSISAIGVITDVPGSPATVFLAQPRGASPAGRASAERITLVHAQGALRVRPRWETRGDLRVAAVDASALNLKAGASLQYWQTRPGGDYGAEVTLRAARPGVPLTLPLYTPTHRTLHVDWDASGAPYILALGAPGARSLGREGRADARP